MSKYQTSWTQYERDLEADLYEGQLQGGTPKQVYENDAYRQILDTPGSVPWAYFLEVYQALGEALKEEREKEEQLRKKLKVVNKARAREDLLDDISDFQSGELAGIQQTLVHILDDWADPMRTALSHEQLTALGLLEETYGY